MCWVTKSGLQRAVRSPSACFPTARRASSSCCNAVWRPSTSPAQAPVPSCWRCAGTCMGSRSRCTPGPLSNCSGSRPTSLRAAPCHGMTSSTRHIATCPNNWPRPQTTPRALAMSCSRCAHCNDLRGGISVRALAAEMNLSERRLQQLFASQLGLPPGVWRRLQRLHGTLRLLRMAQTPQWAQIALCAGYYDQSHLINEFRALCGLTPQQFLRRVVSDSSSTAIDPGG